MPPPDAAAKPRSKTIDRVLSLVAAFIVVAIIIIARYRSQGICPSIYRMMTPHGLRLRSCALTSSAAPSAFPSGDWKSWMMAAPSVIFSD